jgi:hypothetical protein
MGRRQQGTAQANIERALPALRQYPNEFCTGCPVATLFLNQTAEKALRDLVRQWIDGETQAVLPTASAT